MLDKAGGVPLDAIRDRSGSFAKESCSAKSFYKDAIRVMTGFEMLITGQQRIVVFGVKSSASVSSVPSHPKAKAGSGVGCTGTVS